MSKLQQVAMLAALAGALAPLNEVPARAWSSIPARPGKLKTGTRKALRQKRKAQRQFRKKPKK